MQASFQCFQRTAVATVCAAVWLMQFMPAAAQAQTGDAGHRQDCEVRVTDAPLEFRQFDKVELTGSAIIDARDVPALDSNPDAAPAFLAMILMGAVVALFHDVFLTFGMIALFKLEFSLNMVAAILTVWSMFYYLRRAWPYLRDAA